MAKKYYNMKKEKDEKIDIESQKQILGLLNGNHSDGYGEH